MAVERRDMPITREEVHRWIHDYEGPISGLRDYLNSKVSELNLEDDHVVTPEGDAHIVDVIMWDLGSYV